MEIGALICKPLNPLCNKCPISFNCLSFKKKNFELNSINKFKKKVFFEISIFQNKNKKYLLIKNKKFTFLKEMLIFPMKEITKLNFKNHIGIRINIKMSNMNMCIVLKRVKNYIKSKNQFLIGNNELNKLTLPSFTKKILNTINKI